MKLKPGKFKQFGRSLQENLVSIQPAILAGISLLVSIITATIIMYPENSANSKLVLILYGVFGSLYLGFYYYLYTTSPNKLIFAWANAVIAGVALGTITYFIPREFHYLIYTLIFIAALTTSVISTRGPAYFLVFCISIFHIVQHIQNKVETREWVIHAGLMISALMAVEIIQQLKDLAQKQIKRLEILNEVSRQIVSTLETDQLLSLLNAAFQNVLEADTYYIGILEGEQIHMQLFYDDGEYYNNVHVKKAGTLSGWVIDHQQELFLSDLRNQVVALEGVEYVLGGKSKGSLSWMGVPMKGSHVNGVMVISSYHHNAFNQSDLELLNNIAQRAALALDNAHHHAMVQQEARLDSLTRVYNHGYFIKSLREKAAECALQKLPLSLIMLDIDYFKHYNDRYGHQIGDEVLVSLCNSIRENVKVGDSVGRWGGEEFAIALPGANESEALEVAKRVQTSMRRFKLQVSVEKTIPFPTVSQGIAVFPYETDDISKLIDIADGRLYVAKERGRNQIESSLTPTQQTD
jgi:diguanylate cyclase (GGDEF)-like protein